MRCRNPVARGATLLGMIATLGLLAPAMALARGQSEAAAEAPPYRRVLIEEARSKAVCEAQPDRIFVRHRQGTECIAYFVTRGQEMQRRAVVFLDGDLPREKMTEEAQAKILDNQRKFLQKLAERHGMPFIAVSRPGVLGSSGDHGERRKPAEALSVNAAVDALKLRLGIDEIVLAGQSGGATVAASLLTLGRTDVTCAVLGSGNLAVVELFMERQAGTGRRFSREAVLRTFYDPVRNVAAIAPDRLRRVFVIGDPNDQRTPFAQQQRFAESLKARGHHAEVVTVTGAGPDNHYAGHLALPAAGLCAASASDERIMRAVQPRTPPATASQPVEPRRQPASAGIDL